MPHAPDTSSRSERDVRAGEITLHLREARPLADDAAPLVVLLHGFPESSYTWEAQLDALAQAGFWAVAPDLRGYGGSDRPRDVRAYRVEALAADVAALVRALGRTRAHVVGHDWGGVVAWHVAMEYPELVERLCILNVPHPVVMGRGLRTARQLLRSWYIFFFQTPAVPELALSAFGHLTLRRSLAADGLPEDHVDRYVAALAAPGALSAAIAYYRASLRRVATREPPRIHRVLHDVLVVWGDRDRHLGRELAEPPRGLVPNARVVHLPSAGHWVHVDAADEVSRLLVRHLSRAPDS